MMKAIHLRSILLGLVLLPSGCGGPTPQQRDNRRALEAILTAITMKNARLLEEGARRARERHDTGHLTAEQYRGMEACVVRARGGDWAGAEKDCYELRRKHPFVRDGR
jgi:hypothetical protein